MAASLNTNISIEQIRGLGNFSLTNNWKFRLEPVGSEVTSIVNNIGDINARAISTGVPTKSLQDITVTIRGHTVHRPGDLNYGSTFDCTLVGTEDNRVEEFVREYYEKCCTRDHLAQHYKKDIECAAIFTRLDSANNEIYEYKLIGAWLSNANFPAGDATASAMNINVTFTYDYFKERSLGNGNANLGGIINV